jgi:hypothetical protein
VSGCLLAQEIFRIHSCNGALLSLLLQWVLSLSPTGADRLKRQVNLVARQNNALQRNGPLGPLLEAVAGVRVPAGLMRDITAAINQDGELADSSSEQVNRL